MDENKAELQKLHNREAPYTDVPSEVYWKNGSDGETIEFYGLNRGENAPPTDASWRRAAKTEMQGSKENTLVPASPATRKITGDSDVRPYWDRLYSRDPSTQPYWPIWQDIISASNGALVNDPIF
jgi:hypothetical protein